MKNWHCYINNQACGPYPENLLRELIDRGQLTVGTYVYNDSPEDAPKGWQRAGDTEIAALFLNNPQRTLPLPPIQNTGTSRVSPAASQENAENRPRRFSYEGEATALRGTSDAPLILGVIGSVLMIPGIGCSVCLAAGIGAGSGAISGNKLAAAGGIMGGAVIGLVLAVLPIILGIVGGVKGKSSPKTSGLLLAIATMFAAIAWFLTMFVSLFYLAAFILYLIGAIIAYTQKKAETPLEY
jgi:hypothetical protein